MTELKLGSMAAYAERAGKSTHVLRAAASTEKAASTIQRKETAVSRTTTKHNPNLASKK